jgi:hypothetical protein
MITQNQSFGKPAEEMGNWKLEIGNTVAPVYDRRLLA